MRRPGQPQLVQRLPLAFAEAEFDKRLVQHPVEPATEAVDAIDDPLDLEIDPWEVVLLQEAVDVVSLFTLRHVLILDQKPLDVKSLHL